MGAKMYHLHGENYLTFDEETGRISAVYNDKDRRECFLNSIDAFYGLQAELFRIFGVEYWLIQQKAGEGAGRVSAKSFPRTSQREIWEAVKAGFSGISRWGFGRYVLMEVDVKNRHVVFELHDSVFEHPGENNEYAQFIEEPHYLIGFYKGFLTTLFGESMRCSCSRISGAKPYYRFELRPEFNDDPLSTGGAMARIELASHAPHRTANE